MHTCEQLKHDLSALGISAGDSVLMHSSYKSLGGLEGGAAAFFDTFLDLLTPEGNLILPALSYATVTREQPVFDLRTTPSCIGYLPEYFRTSVPGVLRSLHPTHSCCAKGKDAEWITAGHENDNTPVGQNSPFYKMQKLNGWILILGSHPDHNTTLHGVEETAEPPYLLDHDHPIAYTLYDKDGNIVTQPAALRHHFTRENIVYNQRYARILNLLEGDEVHCGKVLDADCVLMYAPAVWGKGKAALEKDPYYFVEIAEK
ncbi:MAG: AAC(3) family N-acetyltransferase [Clostridia bacterium]|nr:AAC(3) family N-acetyltransferase [Clostridia bacterium]